MRLSSTAITVALAATLAMTATEARASVADGVDYLVLPPEGESLPEGCSFGRATPTSVKEAEVSLEDVQNAYEASIDLWEQLDDEDENDQTTRENLSDGKTIYEVGKAIYDLFESSEYLRIEGPTHVLRGSYHRFKGNLFNMYAYVSFYTNESGYVGRDKSNFYANAYLNVKFEKEWGAGLVWISRGDLCSAKAVWVQNAPEIDLVVNANRTATISYEIDPYSKAYLNGDSVRVSVTQSGIDKGSFTIPAGRLSGTHTIYNFSYGAGVPVVASFSDGTYTAEDRHLLSLQQSKRSSPACLAACPASLGVYQSQCMGMTPACN